ncbi:C4-dicarboxylate TRAP transporter substrate-binding protein [Salinicoccus albus]|uniref:C4-dicarboxylate TRAP transporter substrate-binding protein n=1 Tax=Salinicoccus albus TaxID=418756 RepID=UPI00037D3F13|nr:C4-dicarboxylate TRAP transporter substrate-binding protein [Salinicoccus albus]
MKQSIFYILIALLLFTASCTKKEETQGEETQGEVHTLNIAYGNNTDEPIHKQAEKWKELAEDRSDGRLELNLYPSSQLGDEADMIEMAINGNNIIVLTAYDFLMDYVPDFGILNAPYLTEDEEDLFYLTETNWFEGLENDLRNDFGLEMISKNTLYGDRHMMTQNPVKTPEDLQGMRIRVPDNMLYTRSFSEMGASPTSMPLGDLYSSLNQGVVDGAENPLPVLTGSRTHEVTNHLSLTGHMTVIASWVGSSSVVSDLPNDLEQILKETSMEAGEYGQKLVKEEERETLQNLEENGMNIHEVNQNLFAEESEDVYDSIPSWSDGLYDHVQNLLDEKES